MIIEKGVMREIKFRGKSIENKNIGEWAVGDLHLLSPFAHIHTGLGTKCKIDPNTVGQFTGLKDKNTKDIYEGDILCEIDNDRKVVVVYDAPQFCYADNKFGYRFLNLPDNYIVVGNIHDNPELLKSL